MLILIRGLPGSGKSSFARKYFSNCVQIEADDYFYDTYDNYVFDKTRLHQAHKQCQKRTFQALQCDANVVVCNTFTTHKEMRPYLEMAQELGHEVQVMIMQNEYTSVHNVPQETINAMRRRFEL